MAVYSPPDEKRKNCVEPSPPRQNPFFLNKKGRGMSRLCGAISMNGQKLEKINKK